MSRVFPEGSAKAGAGKGGGPDQYTGTWEWACDREILECVAAAACMGIPRTRVASRCCSFPWWGRKLSCRVHDRYLESIQNTVSHSYRMMSQYRTLDGYLLSAQCMRLFCDAIEVSGGRVGRCAVMAGSRLAGEAGRQRRASARQSVGQQVDDTGEVMTAESHSNVSVMVAGWCLGCACDDATAEVEEETEKHFSTGGARSSYFD
jgi:hypothetical protein